MRPKEAMQSKLKVREVEMWKSGVVYSSALPTFHNLHLNSETFCPQMCNMNNCSSTSSSSFWNRNNCRNEPRLSLGKRRRVMIFMIKNQAKQRYRRKREQRLLSIEQQQPHCLLMDEETLPTKKIIINEQNQNYHDGKLKKMDIATFGSLLVLWEMGGWVCVCVWGGGIFPR